MNCLMLTAIRSGSTYLVRLLKKTGHFHYPEPHSYDPTLIPQRAINEFLAPNPVVDPWSRDGRQKTREECISYFKHKASFKTQEPVLLKILEEQYRYYMFNDGDRNLVEEAFPDSRYIWLERKDVIARTISAYVFFETKTPHIYDDRMMEQYRRKKVEFDDRGVLDVYRNHVCRRGWSGYLEGVDHLKVNYEDLVASPAEILERCLDYLGLDKSNIDINRIVDEAPKFRTERPENKEWEDRLRQLLRKKTI